MTSDNENTPAKGPGDYWPAQKPASEAPKPAEQKPAAQPQPEPSPTVTRPTDDTSAAPASFKDYLRSREFWTLVATVMLAGLGVLAAILFLILPIYTRHGSEVTVPEVTGLTVTQAEEKLALSDLSLEVIDSQYVASQKPGIVISQTPQVLEKVKPGRTIYLTVNKLTPPTTKMPDILDVNIQQARYMLETWGLKVGRIGYRAGDAPDLVLAAKFNGKDIKTGDPIQVGSSIDLDISRGGRGASEVVTLPDLEGLSLGEATAQLSALGLRIGQVKTGSSSEHKGKGIVFKQSPGAESQVTQGSSIDLFITGSGEEVTENVADRPDSDR